MDETGQPGGVTPGINGNGRGHAADHTRYNESWASSGSGWSSAGAALEPALESVLPDWRRPADPLASDQDTDQDPPDEDLPPSTNRQNSPNGRNGSTAAYPDRLDSLSGGGSRSGGGEMPSHRGPATNGYEQIRPTYIGGESTSAPPYPYEGDIEDAARSVERVRPKIPSERPMPPSGGRFRAPSAEGSASADPAGPASESVRHRAVEEDTPARGMPLIGVPLFRETAQASKPVSSGAVSATANTGSTGQNPVYEPGYEPAQGYENPPGYQQPPGFEPRSAYEPPPYEPPRSEPSRSEPPRSEPPRGPEPPPRGEAPRSEPPRYDPARYEPRRYEPSQYEPPSYEPPRYESPRYEPPGYDSPSYGSPAYAPPASAPAPVPAPSAPAPSSGPPAPPATAPPPSGSPAGGAAQLSTVSSLPSLSPPAEVPSQRGEPAADVLPQRVPAEPDVPVVPEQQGEEPAPEAPELARIWTHLRREEGPTPQQRPDGFDVNAVLDAVRGVPGVRDATLRNNPGRAHSLRLELADGADPALVSRTVTRLLGERMGLAASPPSGAAASAGVAGAAPSSGIGRGVDADARRPPSNWAGGTASQSTLSRGSQDQPGIGGGGVDEPFLGGGLEQPGYSGFDQPGYGSAPERPDRGTVRMGQSGQDEGARGWAGAQGGGSSASGRATPLRVPPYLANQSDPATSYDAEPSTPMGLSTPATFGPAAATVPNRPGGGGPRTGIYSPDYASEAPGGYAARESGPYTRDLAGYGEEQNVPQVVPPRPLDPGERPGPRVLIDQVLISTYGLDATVEVRLTADGRRASGQASGPAVDSYVLRLAAVAAGKAINQLLRGSGRQEQGQCYVEHAAVMPFGTSDVAVVVVLLSCGGWVEQLAGSALVAGDQRQAVVRATLAAVNRRLEALLT